MAKILILGGGFGGLIAAERLAANLDTTHQITLVAPNRKFTFYPGLVHLAFEECETEYITFDVGAKITDIGVSYVLGEMIRIDTHRKKVEVAGEDLSGEIGYDFLVIALGRRLATEKVGGFFEYSHHLLGTGAALKFRDAVTKFEKGRILVGLCPDARLPVPMCETAFALARQFKAEIKEKTIAVSIVFPGSLEEAFGGARLHKELEEAFKRHHIDVHYDIPISEISADEVFSSNKHQIRYDLLMLIPPFRGNASLRDLGVTDDSDFVLVDDLMRVYLLDNVYAIGDIVAFSGPKLAHMAVRQAVVAAANITSEINGEKPSKAYYHEIATIIDAGGPESIYLHYGIWDDSLYRLKKGRFWSVIKEFHDGFWQARHR